MATGRPRLRDSGLTIGVGRPGPRNAITDVSCVPIGRSLQPPAASQPERAGGGSVMVVLAIDAPLTSWQLRRLCVRAAAGLARTGSVHAHGSGDFVIAFSTAHRVEHDPRRLVVDRAVLADEGTVMRRLFPAVAESVEKAVLNSLWRAETIVGRDSHTRYALPLDDVAELIDARDLR